MKLCVGRIAGRYIEVQHAEAFEDFLLYLQGQSLTANDLEWRKKLLFGDADLERARSRLATWFLDETDDDVLLAIDTDIVFEPRDALRLAQEAHDEQAVIGGLYMTRSLRSQPAISLLPGAPVAFSSDGRLTPVRFLSGGFMAVPRAVFKRLISAYHGGTVERVLFGTEHYYDFYGTYVASLGTEKGTEKVRLSEDWAFVGRAADAGYRVLLDPTIRLGHVGEYEWRLEDLTRDDREVPFSMILTHEKDGFLRVARLPGRSA